MTQYQNNLIGKHFKTLMQTMVFHVHDITTPMQFALIRAVGALGALLWIPEIDNMDQFLVSLKFTSCSANLLLNRTTLKFSLEMS